MTVAAARQVIHIEQFRENLLAEFVFQEGGAIVYGIAVECVEQRSEKRGCRFPVHDHFLHSSPAASGFHFCDCPFQGLRRYCRRVLEFLKERGGVPAEGLAEFSGVGLQGEVAADGEAAFDLYHLRGIGIADVQFLERIPVAVLAGDEFPTFATLLTL